MKRSGIRGEVLKKRGVIPANAAIHLPAAGSTPEKSWIPACAGMTAVVLAPIAPQLATHSSIDILSFDEVIRAPPTLTRS